MKTRYIINSILTGMLLGSVALTSCTEPESNMVEFAENNRLNTPNDTIYSLLGVISNMQKVADRTVLLGELRGDLMAPTGQASLALQELSDYSAGTDNPYNQISDYYAIIQNCNYFIANADLNLQKRGRKVFEKEFAAIKAYRAWTYLQLAQIYGTVPFVTAPVLTEKDADPNLFPQYDIRQIAEYFIADLAPYVDTDYPQYGEMGGIDSRLFYLPVRVLLGDCCLWAGRYAEAAKYYHDYITKTGDTHPLNQRDASWRDNTFQDVSSSYNINFAVSNANHEILAGIPMEVTEFDGTVSYLDDVFSSTLDNNYYNQVEYTPAHLALSQAQQYTMIYVDKTTQHRDTIAPPADLMYPSEVMRGDLRLSVIVNQRNVSTSNSNYSQIRTTFSKVNPEFITLYRLNHVYLRYAEALNRAGFPNAAFTVLKYGLCQENVLQYVPAEERQAAGELLKFNFNAFDRLSTYGIHSHGSGDCNADKSYVIPALPSKTDSITYVEDRIVDEMALETIGEGLRFGDLMRVALRRNAPAYLAAKVAGRKGSSAVDNALYSKLCDTTNWYLPK